MRTGESPAHSTVELALETSLAPSKDLTEPDGGSKISAYPELQEQGNNDLGNSLAKDQENYFISPEAQKLAGKILEESQLEADEKSSNLVSGELETREPDQEAVLQPPGESAEIESAARPTSASNTPAMPPAVEHASVVSLRGNITSGSATSVTAEEANMTSKSSTIFVDMSNLNVQEDT